MGAFSDVFMDELYLAGERVPSGLYREIGTGRLVKLDEEDVLPASLDGRVATYVCVRYTWHEHTNAVTVMESVHRPMESAPRL